MRKIFEPNNFLPQTELFKITESGIDFLTNQKILSLMVASIHRTKNLHP